MSPILIVLRSTEKLCTVAFKEIYFVSIFINYLDTHPKQNKYQGILQRALNS